MAAFTEGFDEATSGSIVANTGGCTVDAVAGACVYAASPEGRSVGAASLPVAVANLAWTTDAGAPILSGPAYGRIYVYLPAQLAAWTGLFLFQDRQGAYLGNGFVNLSSSANTLQLRSLNNTASAGSYTLLTNTWYRLELDVHMTNKTVTGRIYLGESVTPLSTLTTTWTTVSRTNVNGQLDAVRVANEATSAGPVYVDDVAFSTVSQPGPVAGAPTAWNYHVIQG